MPLHASKSPNAELVAEIKMDIAENILGSEVIFKLPFLGLTNDEIFECLNFSFQLGEYYHPNLGSRLISLSESVAFMQLVNKILTNTNAQRIFEMLSCNSKDRTNTLLSLFENKSNNNTKSETIALWEEVEKFFRAYAKKIGPEANTEILLLLNFQSRDRETVGYFVSRYGDSKAYLNYVDYLNRPSVARQGHFRYEEKPKVAELPRPSLSHN